MRSEVRTTVLRFAAAVAIACFFRMYDGYGGTERTRPIVAQALPIYVIGTRKEPGFTPRWERQVIGQEPSSRCSSSREHPTSESRAGTTRWPPGGPRAVSKQ